VRLAKLIRHTAAALSLVTLPATASSQTTQRDTVPRPTCFRGRPKPRCDSFWFTEFAATPRLNANPSGAGGPDYYYTWDYGLMSNVGEKKALGGGLFLGGEDDGFRFGVKFRYRRWLTPRTPLDFSPGILIAGGDNQRKPQFPGFTGSVGVMHADLVGIAVQFEVVPDSARTLETAWYGGVKFGSYPGLIMSVVGPIIIAIAIGNSFE
jgi:hypothetical protein